MVGITGTGYVLQELIDMMVDLQKNHAEAVKKVKVEKTPNIPFYAGPLQLGKYDMFVVCPTSANSVAKIVCGIADTLITNCVAQAIKGGQTVYIFPSDQDTEPITTTRPDGSPLVLKIRDIELENITKLKTMEGIVVLSEFSDIRNLIIQKVNQ